MLEFSRNKETDLNGRLRFVNVTRNFSAHLYNGYTFCEQLIYCLLIAYNLPHKLLLRASNQKGKNAS